MRTPNPFAGGADPLKDPNTMPATEVGDPDFKVLRDHMTGQGLPLPVAHRLAAMVAHTMQKARGKGKQRPENKRLVPQGLAAPIGRKGNLKP